MNSINIGALADQLKIDEGVRLKPYRDTVGKLTIGIGRNLDDVGISNEEAHDMLLHDIQNVLRQLDKALPWWRDMSTARQSVLGNLCFNMGITTLLTFKNTLLMMEQGNYAAAAEGMLNSKWAKQTGQRALRLASQMRQG